MKKYLLSIVLLVLLIMPVALAMPVSLAAGNIKINDFSADVTNGTTPLHTRFTSDVTGNPVYWRWIFENTGTGNITYSGANVTTPRVFGKPGVYNVTLKVGGPDGNDTLTKPAYINVVSVNTDTKVQNETTASESFPMNPNWEPKDKQHYLDGYYEGYMIGLINGYDHGYDLGIEGLEYTEKDRSNFEPKCTTPQDIGYAAGYNAGHKERFLSGYNDGYNIYMQEYMD